MTVDLIYDPDCPNVALARSNLMRALGRLGLAPQWSEYRIGDPSAPKRTHGFGSPTVLVNGRDVAGLERSSDACCRLYQCAEGWLHAPSPEQISEAILIAQRAEE